MTWFWVLMVFGAFMIGGRFGYVLGRGEARLRIPRRVEQRRAADWHRFASGDWQGEK